MLTLQRKIGSSKQAIVTALQCLVCCCHYVADDLLTILYPWLNAHTSDSKPKTSSTYTSTTKEGEDEKVSSSTSTNTNTNTNTNNGESDMNIIKKKKKKKKKVKIEYSDEARVLSLRLRRLLHQAIADLIDPGRIFTSHMLVSSYVGSDAKALTKAASKGRFYTTSVAVRSIFGDAANDSTRRFMQVRT